jgi:hypothetical protein
MGNSCVLMKRVCIVTLILLLAVASTAMARQGQSSKAGRQDRPERYSPEWIDGKIVRIHDKLQITSEQEPTWEKVAVVIKENSLAMKALIDKYTSQSAQLTALESMRMHGEMAEEHAKGQQKLVAAFESLYNAMPAEQKAVADKVFARHEKRGRPHKKR